MSFVISILLCIFCCVSGMLFHSILGFFNFQASFLLTLILLIGNDNPCEDGNFKFLNKAGQRGGNCKIQASNVVCDHFISDGWYKVLHEDDLKPRKILDTRVDPNFCGTSNPIWLNGKQQERETETESTGKITI